MFSVRLVWACVLSTVLRFRFGCFRFPLGFLLRFLLRFTSACAIVLIWGWLGVCLVSIQSCCSVSLVPACFFFPVVIGSMGFASLFQFLLCSAWVYFVLV